jgi:hypothetical protein
MPLCVSSRIKTRRRLDLSASSSRNDIAHSGVAGIRRIIKQEACRITAMESLFGLRVKARDDDDADNLTQIAGAAGRESKVTMNQACRLRARRMTCTGAAHDLPVLLDRFPHCSLAGAGRHASLGAT